MRALVTGCAGFVGSTLSERLLSEGWEVRGVDCFNDNYARREKLLNLHRAQAWETFEFLPIDLARGDLMDLVADSDVICHLAAEPGVRGSWGPRFEHYVRNNILATQHLLEACAAFPDKRFVYASSSSIYGDVDELPILESTTPRPFSPYGVTKLAAEHLCGLYHQNHGSNTVSLRYFSVYGPRQRPDMAFHRFCGATLAGEEVLIVGDGRQTRDFTYVDDVVHATCLAMERPGVAGRCYNIGGGSKVSVNRALDLLSELAGRPVGRRHLPHENGDVRDTQADTARAHKELGFKPKVKLTEGLGVQLEWAAGALGR